MRITRLTSAAALGAALWIASPVQAQTYHMPATPEKGVWMEASYVDLRPIELPELEMEVSFPSSTWFLAGRMPINDRFRAVADLPFAHAKASFFGSPNKSNTVLGNPYVGVEFLTERLVLETGVRLPLTTADDDSFADVVAFFGDVQRFEAFVEDVVPVSGAMTYTHGFTGGISLQARTGVVGLFYTGDDDADSEALIDYGLLATYPMGAARFGLGGYGRWISTEDEGSFSDNSVHHLALSADYKVRGVRPGISIRVPVDKDWDDIVSSTIGLYLQVPLR